MGFSEGIHPGKPFCNLYSINPFTKSERQFIYQFQFHWFYIAVCFS